MKGQLMKEQSTSPNETETNTNIQANGTPDVGCKSVAFVTSPRPLPRFSRDGAAAFFMVLLASLISGLVLTTCFFPLSWGALAWVALVPLILVVRSRAGFFSAAFASWLGGMAFCYITMSWMPATNEMMTMAWYVLSFYCSWYFPVAILLIRLVDRRTGIPLLISAPAVWVTLDFVRSVAFTGFPWYYMAHTQHIFLPIIQIADLGGAYMVTFLVVMVNALFAEWFCLVPRVRDWLHIPEPVLKAEHPRRSYYLQSLVVSGLVILSFGYGFWRLGQTDFERGPTVALLQSNIDQNIRNQSSSPEEQQIDQNVRNQSSSPEEQQQVIRIAQQTIDREFDDLCKALRLYEHDIDLIVWPETSFPGNWVDINRNIPLTKVPEKWEKVHARVRDGMRRYVQSQSTKANMLVGITTEYLVEPKNKFVLYNSALYVDKSGWTQGRYDKIHRIPFGEYMPKLPDLPLVKQLSPYGENEQYGVDAGKDLNRFKLGKYSFAVLICYEDSDPVLARQYVVPGHINAHWNPLVFLESLRREIDGIRQEPKPPVDFLVNMSNDGWYAGTSEHNEHLAIARFRSIETRRATVRSVNMGISAVIDGNGKVLHPYQLPTSPKERKNSDPLHQWVIDDRAGLANVPNLPVSLWNEFKQHSGVLVSVVPIDRRTSLYAHGGDWLVYLCCLFVLAGIIGALAPRPRRLGTVK